MFIVNHRLPLSEKIVARWSNDHQIWYTGDEVLEDFGTASIHFPFYEVHSITKCWKCKKKTPVVTLGASKAYVRHIEYFHPENIILCYEMHQLPDDLIEHFLKFESFKLVSTKKNGNYWGNECVECGIVQGDYFLFEDTLNGGPYNTSTLKSINSENMRVEPITGLEGQRIISAKFMVDDAFIKTIKFQENYDVIKEKHNPWSHIKSLIKGLCNRMRL